MSKKSSPKLEYQYLKEEYLDKRKTLGQVAKEAGCTAYNVRKWLKYYGIRIRKKYKRNPDHKQSRTPEQRLRIAKGTVEGISNMTGAERDVAKKKQALGILISKKRTHKFPVKSNAIKYGSALTRRLKSDLIELGYRISPIQYGDIFLPDIGIVVFDGPTRNVPEGLKAVSVNCTTRSDYHYYETLNKLILENQVG